MLKTSKKFIRGILSAACILGSTISNLPIAAAANIEGPEVFWKISMWGNPRALSVGREELAKKQQRRQMVNSRSRFQNDVCGKLFSRILFESQE